MHTIRGVWRDGLETQPFGDGAESALRFSAIITFYNQRDFVRTALDSALSQGVEVVAVDDGSTDGTRELLSEYRDRVRLVLLEENVGACAARNAGADAATGDYLAYLDGDDAFMPWALDTYRAVAESLAPALMMGPMYWFDEDEPPEPPAPRGTFATSHTATISPRNASWTSASARSSSAATCSCRSAGSPASRWTTFTSCIGSARRARSCRSPSRPQRGTGRTPGRPSAT